MAVKDMMSGKFIPVTEETPVGEVVERVNENPAAEYLVVRLQQGYAVIEMGPNRLQSELDGLADRIGPGILEMALGDVLELDWWRVASVEADEPQPVEEAYAVVLEGEQVVGVTGWRVDREKAGLRPVFSDVSFGGGLPSTLFGERYVFGREGKKGGRDARTCPHCGQSFAYYKVKASKGKVVYTCPECGAEEPNP